MIKQRRWAKHIMIAILLSGTVSVHSQQRSARPTTINDLFELIEANSKSLRAQRTGLEMANEAIKTAKAERLPDISAQLSASYLGNGFITDRDFSNYSKAPIPHFGNNFALEASQVVYSGGALTNNINLAELSRRQSELSIEQNRQQIRFIALGQYLDMYKLMNQMKVYRQNIELTNQLINNVRARQQQGTALKNDITRYELQMESLKLGLTKLNNSYEILNYQLCNTIGLTHEIRICPDTTIIDKSYQQDGHQFWQNSAAASSPMAKQAAIDVDINRAKEKIQHAELLPKVSLVAADHLDGPITIEVPPINKNFNYWYIGIGVKYNIGALYKANKKIKRAQLAVRQSTENQTVVNENLDNAVQAGYTEYLQSFVELRTQQKSVELARQNYKVINDRYLNQLALITDMVDASNMKLSAELQEVNARIGIVYAYYKMKYIAGTL
jgi:outer membrane protein TolC